jgi:hypothetical protein
MAPASKGLTRRLMGPSPTPPHKGEGHKLWVPQGSPSPLWEGVGEGSYVYSTLVRCASARAIFQVE